MISVRRWRARLVARSTVVLFGVALGGVFSGGRASRAPQVSSASPFWTLTWDGQRLLATIPRPLLGTDFVLLKQVVDIQPSVGEAYVGMEDGTFGTSAGGSSEHNLNSPGIFHWAAGPGDSLWLVPYQAQPGNNQTIAVPIVRHAANGMIVADVGAVFDLRWRLALPTVVTTPPRLEVEVAEMLQDQRVVWHWSIASLPASPMLPRVAAGRLGAAFFAVTTLLDPTKTVDTPSVADSARVACSYLTRWRLEKKQPSVALSSVVHPIVFDLDPTIPAKWRPWVKQGVEAWQPVFAAFGFQDAIVARELPRPDSSRRWLPDATHTLLLWAHTNDQKEQEFPGDSSEPGFASLVTDPRTGEILRATVYLSERALPTAWRTFVGTTVPYSDSAMGPLLAAMVSHEVGHALGLTHRMGQRPPSIMGYEFFTSIPPGAPRSFAAQITSISAEDRALIAAAYASRPTPPQTTARTPACPVSP